MFNKILTSSLLSIIGLLIFSFTDCNANDLGTSSTPPKASSFNLKRDQVSFRDWALQNTIIDTLNYKDRSLLEITVLESSYKNISKLTKFAKALACIYKKNMSKYVDPHTI